MVIAVISIICEADTSYDIRTTTWLGLIIVQGTIPTGKTTVVPLHCSHSGSGMDIILVV
jgi:hypothetical protein